MAMPSGRRISAPSPKLMASGTAPSIAAIFGALPLALGHGAGSELRRPLGIAIVGGLMVSQMLTLYTTPVIHLALRTGSLRLQALWFQLRGRPAPVPAE